MSLTPKEVEVLGMPLDEWEYESCIAHFGVGEDWATLYDIISQKPGEGHATVLLRAARDYYTNAQGKKVWGSVPLNERMAKLYEKVGIPVAPEPDESELFQEVEEAVKELTGRQIEVNEEFLGKVFDWTQQVYAAIEEVYNSMERSFKPVLEKAQELGILEIVELDDKEEHNSEG